MVMVVGDAGDMSPSSEVSVKENVLKFAARIELQVENKSG
jgi:hypothetical protein